MWNSLVTFFTAGLAASFALGVLFVAQKKIKGWYWALFLGVVGMAVSAFSYIIPDVIPHGDQVFIISVMGMMAGVFVSYYLHPVEESSPDARLLVQDQRRNGLWLVGIGVSIISILTLGAAYYLSHDINARTATTLTGMQYLILQRLDQQGRAIVRLEGSEATRQQRDLTDDAFKAQVLKNQKQSLQNQQQGLSVQKQVKRDLKQANARAARPNPIVIRDNLPPLLPSDIQPLPDKIAPLPVATGKKKGNRNRK